MAQQREFNQDPTGENNPRDPAALGSDRGVGSRGATFTGGEIDPTTGNLMPGSAKTASEQLGAAGFLIGNVANGQSTQTGSPAVVRYGTGGVDKARTVAAWVNGNAAVEEDPTLGGSIQLLLLPAYSGIATSDAAQAKLSQPVPVASGPGCSPSATAPASEPAASPQASSEATSGTGQQGGGTSDQGATTDSGQGTQGSTQGN